GGVAPRREVEHDEVRAGVDEELRRKRVGARGTDAPGAAVDEDVDRRGRALGCPDVEGLDGRRAVGEALRCAEASAHRVAVRDVAPGDLLLVGRVHALVVGVVELGLIHVEPDPRPLGPLRERGRRRRAGARRRGAKDGAPRDRHFAFFSAGRSVQRLSQAAVRGCLSNGSPNIVPSMSQLDAARSTKLNAFPTRYSRLARRASSASSMRPSWYLLYSAVALLWSSGLYETGVLMPW